MDRRGVIVFLLDAVGLGLLMAGCALFSPALALVVLGIGLLVFARTVERGRPPD